MGKNLGPLQELVRLYTFHSPIRKGKYRLAMASMKLATKVQSSVLAKTVDGRKLFTSLSDVSSQFLYFLGEYEPTVTDVVSRLVEPGDICLDIGANIGWYTTLLQTLVAPNGSVHAFEPLPRSFETLRQNVELNKHASGVRLNAVALGETDGEVDLHVFADLPESHASVSDLGQSVSTTFRTKLITLDSYLESQRISDVTFAKVDIEGSELAMLKGAERLLGQTMPPIFEIEMALATSRHFGHLPNDLIAFMRSRAAYDFYAIDERQSTLRPIDRFLADDVGANVLCVPQTGYRDRLTKFKIVR